jgi:hypothetical protein
VTQLFSFGGFSHDPQGVLAAVYGLALVGFELSLNMILELRVAALADSQNRNTVFSFYDPESARLHGFSLAHSSGRV